MKTIAGLSEQSAPHVGPFANLVGYRKHPWIQRRRSMLPLTDKICVVVLTLVLKIALNNTADITSEAASSTNLDAVSRAANGEEV
jgi:hypothetical protein